MGKHLSTPVLFLVFNRPDTTAKVFAEIRRARPSKLYVAADGPRGARKGEKEVCEEVRKIATAVDWKCEVKTLFRKKNLGCGLAVSQAITWFFKNEKMGIILEDDCLPDQSFFSYCSELLKKYEKNEKIWHISGDNYQHNGGVRTSYSYFFSKYTHIWGWASWRRAWKNYDFELKNLKKATGAEDFNSWFNSSEEKQYFLNWFNRMRENPYSTWDIQWMFTCWYNKGLAIYPNKNLVRNIGFDSNSTHNQSTRKFLINTPLESMEKLKHPKKIEINKKADEFTFKRWFYTPWYKAPYSLLPEKVKTVIKRILLR